MLPALAHQNGTEELVLSFLQELEKAGFCGDIESSYASRLAVATDNSVYQQLPQAVIFPTSNQDLVALGELAQRNPFTSITFSPRGGGTGTTANH